MIIQVTDNLQPELRPKDLDLERYFLLLNSESRGEHSPKISEVLEKMKDTEERVVVKLEPLCRNSMNILLIREAADDVKTCI